MSGHVEATWSEHRIPIRGLVLAAKIYGDADAEPLLCLHGWQDSAASFTGLGPYLQGHCVVALDVAGHGCSDHRPAGACYSFLEWVADLEAVRSHFGWQRFRMLGHSLGAGMALAYAGTWPERVSRVACIDGFSPRVAAADEAPALLRRFAERLGRNQHYRPRLFADREALARRLVEAVDGLQLPGARQLAERSAREVSGGVSWACDDRVRNGAPLQLTAEHMAAFFRRVICPVLVVRPRQGWPYSPRALAMLEESLCRLRICDIDGAHHVHLDDPAGVAALILPFLHDSDGVFSVAEP